MSRKLFSTVSDRYAIVWVANCVIVNLHLPCARTDNPLSICDEILADIGHGASDFQIVIIF